jgi:microcystin-dependent protein
MSWPTGNSISAGLVAVRFLVPNDAWIQIVCFPADNMQYIGQDPLNGDSQFRKCDGAYYDKAVFPLCYDVIGDTFGSTTYTFAVPDLRGRVIVDAGAGSGLTPRSLGDNFGEEQHTLNTSEIPSHVHGIPGTITSLAVEPGELPVLDPNPIPSTTGSTGGGAAHNNLQPSLVLFWYIQVSP